MTDLNRRQVKVAAIQMVSSADIFKNVENASCWIARAAERGAAIIALPEYFCFMGFENLDKSDHAETFGVGLT